MTTVDVIGAPSHAGLRPSGTVQGVGAGRAAGLIGQLRVHHDVSDAGAFRSTGRIGASAWTLGTYNPDLDLDGRVAMRIVDELAEWLDHVPEPGDR